MTLFTTVSMDAALLLFMGLIACKFVIFKDKPSRGLKWMIAGGLILVIQIILSVMDWQLIGVLAFFPWMSFSLVTIAVILVIIGGIKAILELFE